MYYILIKHLHICCVVSSISLFVVRGGLQLAGVAWRRWRVLRVLPHLIDTVLLGSATYLAAQLQQYPLVHAWLTAKVLALLVYIYLGRQALRPDTPLARRAAAFGGALLSVAYIVAVALTHSASLGLIEDSLRDRASPQSTETLRALRSGHDAQAGRQIR